VVGRDDQKRVVTPSQAVKNGADYIVVGRPIRDAKSPVDAAKKTGEEIESALG
jgi:orotidine-5'-phosphate decarboxylase